MLVHERHGALRLVTKNPREKLQRQAHVDGHKDVGGVDHHGDGREEEGVEDGLLPGLQHIDARDEQVLVVKPGQVLPEAFEAHLLPRMKAGGEEGEEEGLITALDDLKERWMQHNICFFQSSTELQKPVLYDAAKSWYLYLSINQPL